MFLPGQRMEPRHADRAEEQDRAQWSDQKVGAGCVNCVAPSGGD